MNKHETYLYQFMLVWFGAILALSFIATPAKFLVTELDTVIAIKIGRATFNAFSYFEISMIAILALITVLGQCRRFTVFYVASIILLYAIQQIIVLPIIEANTDALFRGELGYNDNSHYAFIGLELLKLLALVCFSLACRHYYQEGGTIKYKYE